MPHAPFARPIRTLALLVLLSAALTAAAPSLIRIRSGDTLSALARDHHTTVAALQALNHMGGSTTIYAGATLRIPGAPAPPTTSRVLTRTYTVRPGDGLIVVARLLHTTPQVLVRLNGLHRGYLLLGERLRYPVRVTTAAPDPDAASTATHRATLAHRPLPSHATVRQMITAAARRHGVPVSLALALAWQESGFQQGVVSPVDAIGVMQVLPSTGAALGRLHGRTYDLLRASDNVEAGVTLLSDLLEATGSVQTALAGYYQGLGSIASQGLLPQTKRYVSNILALRNRFA